MSVRPRGETVEVIVSRESLPGGKRIEILKIGNARIATFKDNTMFVAPELAGSEAGISILKDNFKATQQFGNSEFYGKKQYAVAAIARSLGFITPDEQKDFKTIITNLLELKDQPLNKFENTASRFNTAAAAGVLGGLAGPSSFAGLPGSGGSGGITSGLAASMAASSLAAPNNDDLDGAIQAAKLAEMIAIAASMGVPTLGGRRKQHGGMERPAETAGAAGTPPPRRRGRASASVSSTGAAPVVNAGSVEATLVNATAADPEPEVQVEAITGALAAIEIRLEAREAAASPASGGGGGGSAAAAVTTSAEAVAAAVPKRRGRGGAATVTNSASVGVTALPIVTDTASVAAITPALTGQVAAVSSAGAPTNPPAAPGGGGGGPQPVPTAAEIKAALVGHLVEWMNANGTFIQEGKDQIMRKLYQFVSSPITKKAVQTTAKMASIATAGTVMASTAAAFYAPGAVLDFYLLIFSYLTGAATTILGSPINLLSRVIVNFLFTIPDSYKFKLFGRIAGQVGDLGSTAGINSIITGIFPGAAAIPGFSQGMFVIDLAIGGYILLNLHRSMGQFSPFTFAGNITRATFGPLLDAVKSAVLRLSTDVRYCYDNLKVLFGSLCTQSAAAYQVVAARVPAVASAAATAGRGIKTATIVTASGVKTVSLATGRGISNVLGYGNTVFWLVVGKGQQGCRTVSDLFTFANRILRTPYSSGAGFRILTTPAQQRQADQIIAIAASASQANGFIGPLPAAPGPDTVIPAITAAAAAPDDTAVAVAANAVEKIQANTATAAASSASSGGGGGSSSGGAANSSGGGGGAAHSNSNRLGGGRRRYKKTHKRRNHKRKQHRTKKHPKRR